MNASQNVGADTPIRQRMRATWSTHPSRRTAAATPSGTPIAMVRKPATVASSIVAGHVLPDVVEHRAAGRDRLAQVAAGEPGEEDPVLLVQRTVQAPARPEAGDGLRVGRLLVPELGEDGIGRDAVGDEENDQGGRRGHRGRGDHPEEDVPEAHPLHGWVVSRGASLLPATLPAIRRFHVGHAGYFAGFTSYRSTCHPAAVSW